MILVSELGSKIGGSWTLFAPQKPVFRVVEDRSGGSKVRPVHVSVAPGDPGAGVSEQVCEHVLVSAGLCLP